MKKRFLTLALLTIGVTSLSSCNSYLYGLTVGQAPAREYKEGGPTIVSGQTYSKFSPEMKNGNYKRRRENSILNDPCFRNGLVLLNQDTSNPYVARVLDYNGNRDTNISGSGVGNNSYWQLCPWWATEFSDFKKDTCFEANNSYIYKNDFRSIEINPNVGSIRMQLNAASENRTRFNGQPVLPDGATWSHCLLQTSFNKVRVTDYKEIHVCMDVEFNHICYQGNNSFKLADSECAQLLIYLSVYNDKGGPRLWYGIPIYDSRYASTPLYADLDKGFVGATGKLIYNMPSSLYMGPNKPKAGSKYSIDVDVKNIPDHNILSAIQYGYDHNLLPQYPSYDPTGNVFGYINLGLEVPGPIDISVTISNLDVYLVN